MPSCKRQPAFCDLGGDARQTKVYDWLHGPVGYANVDVHKFVLGLRDPSQFNTIDERDKVVWAISKDNFNENSAT